MVCGCIAWECIISDVNVPGDHGVLEEYLEVHHGMNIRHGSDRSWEDTPHLRTVLDSSLTEEQCR